MSGADPGKSLMMEGRVEFNRFLNVLFGKLPFFKGAWVRAMKGNGVLEGLGFR